MQQAKTRIKNDYCVQAADAHFVCQPSVYVQQLYLVVTKSGKDPRRQATAVLEDVKGMDLCEFVSKNKDNPEIYEILSQIAGQVGEFLAEEVRLGVSHGDIFFKNLIYNARSGKLKIIDFGDWARSPCDGQKYVTEIVNGLRHDYRGARGEFEHYMNALLPKNPNANAKVLKTLDDAFERCLSSL